MSLLEAILVPPVAPQRLCLPLTSLELSVAEVLRLNQPPEDWSQDSIELWYDLMEALSKLFATGKPRFNQLEFIDHCEGEYT